MLTPVAMTKKDYAEAGEWLAAQITAAGYNRAQVARTADVSASTLKTYVDGGRKSGRKWVLPNPRADILARLSDTLRVPRDEMGQRFGVTLPGGSPATPPASSTPPPAAPAALLEEVAELTREIREARAQERTALHQIEQLRTQTESQRAQFVELVALLERLLAQQQEQP